MIRHLIVLISISRVGQTEGQTMCCNALTAACLACSAGVTVEQICASFNNNVEVRRIFNRIYICYLLYNHSRVQQSPVHWLVCCVNDYHIRHNRVHVYGVVAYWCNDKQFLCFFQKGCTFETSTTVGPVPIAESCTTANQVRCEEGKVTQCKWDVWRAECTPDCAALSRSVFDPVVENSFFCCCGGFLASYCNMIG